MEQMDYGVLSMLQTMAQTQQSVSNTAKSDKDDSFQSLLTQKCQTADKGDQTTQAAQPDQAGNSVQTPVGKQSADPKDDAVAMELVGAQLFVMDPAPQMALNIQPQEQQAPVLETPALTLSVPEEETGVEDLVTTVAEQPAAYDLAQPEVQPQAQTQTQTQAVEINQEQPVEAVPTQVEEQPEQKEDSLDLDLNKGEEEDVRTQVTEAPAEEGQPVFRDVETVMIKVGETAGSREPEQTADVESQLAQPMTKALSQGETKVEIQLTPKSLGTVTVEMTQQKDGGLSVVLTAENSHTRELLRQHVDGLQNLLGGQSQKSVHVEVSRQQESQRDDANYDGRNGQSHSGEQQGHRQRQAQQNQDFLQQLRLGLIPVETEAS